MYYCSPSHTQSLMEAMRPARRRRSSSVGGAILQSAALTAERPGVSILLLLILAAASWQGYLFCGNHLKVQEPGLQQDYTPAGPRFLSSRNRNLVMLQQQVVDKEGEITHLRAQLEHARDTIAGLDANMQTAEIMVRSLSQRWDTERTGRSKAQVALAGRASLLAECEVARHKLMMEREPATASASPSSAMPAM